MTYDGSILNCVTRVPLNLRVDGPAPPYRAVEARSTAMSDAGGRDKLLAAARNLFPRLSYAEVGIARILAEAGVKAPTLYYHFGDKEGLFVAHVANELDNLGAHLRLLTQTHISPQAALADIASALAEFTALDLDGALDAGRRLQKPSNQEKIQESYVRNVFEPIASLLQSAMDRGDLRREPTGRLVVLFQSGALQLCSGKSDLAGKAPSDWWAETFVRAFAAR